MVRVRVGVSTEWESVVFRIRFRICAHGNVSHRLLLFGSKLEFPWDCGTIQSHAKTLPCARSLRYWDRDQGCNSISGAGLDSGLNG